jgi:hypothetical protein
MNVVRARPGEATSGEFAKNEEGDSKTVEKLGERLGVVLEI